MTDKSSAFDVDGVIITDDLDRRPSRVADYQTENRALIALTEALSSSPETVLQQLVEAAMELTHSDSAGISLLERGGEQDIFHWAATAGAWAPFRGGTMPRVASPCSEVIAREAVLLMRNPERLFPALLQAEPGVSEALLAPFYLGGVPVGTLWTIKHSPDEHFEAEDARLIKNLARFASAAHHTVQALHMAETADQRAEIRVQQLVALAEISTEFFGTCDMEFMPIYGNAAAMRMVGLADLEQVKRTPVQEFFFPEDWAFITDEFLPRVMREGQAKVEIRFRHFVTGEPVWVDYSLVVLKDEMGRATGLGTVTHDLTEHKRVEAALRESEERQAFLLKLSDALRPLADPSAVQGEACRLLGEPLDVDRVAYAEHYGDMFIVNRDWARGAASMAGRYQAAAFGDAHIAAYLRGEPFVVDDVAGDPRLDDTDRPAFEAAAVAAFVGVGLVKAGRLIASFGGMNATARAWTHEEVALVQETAERTWAAAERARAEAALRESEERQAFLLRLSDALRPLDDPSAVQGEACRLIGEHLKVERVAYAEHYGDIFIVNREWTYGAASMAGRYQEGQFGDAINAAFLSGEPFVVNDVAQDPRLNDTDRAAFEAVAVAACVGMGLIKAGKLVASFGVLSAMTRAWTHHEVELVREMAERTWAAAERARAEAALRDSEERFRQFSDASTNVLWIRDAETLEMTYASRAFDKIYGISGPERGGGGRLRSWARLIEPENRKTVLANFRRARAGAQVEYEFRIRRASDGALRWIHNTDFPLADSAGNVRWIAGIGADMTDVKEATDRQEVLVAELQHRTRNLIAVVSALADRTLHNAASLEEFGAQFRSRLSALSRVQGLLAHLATGERVTFHALLLAELAAHGASNGLAHKFTLEGPANVPLRSGTLQTFALALHELATNALKYGALAAVDGHLFVGWRIERSADNGSPRLHVEWRESGVDMEAVGPHARSHGYGRELIERALPYQLNAKTTYELGPNGVRCTIDVPISLTASNRVSSDD